MISIGLVDDHQMVQRRLRQAITSQDDTTIIGKAKERHRGNALAPLKTTIKKLIVRSAFPRKLECGQMIKDRIAWLKVIASYSFLALTLMVIILCQRSMP